jgi:copper oxidase (laccase) domain-containing protein
VTCLFHDTVPVATGTVSVAFTDRSLDLGDLAPDDVRSAGLAELAEATGATPYLMHQVHGTTVADVPGEEFPDADGLVSGEAGVALLARAADCVPVLLVERGDRRGPRRPRGGTPGCRDRRRRPAPRPRRHGPAGVGRTPHLRRLLRGPGRDARRGRRRRPRHPHHDPPALDLGAGVLAQLADAGVPATEVGGCTREDEALHSHRRDGAAAGRLAGVVWRTP